MQNLSSAKVGIAPIGWTNDDMPDLGKENTFAQCVSEMALAGFAGCEVGSKFPEDPAVLKKALNLRGLRVCSRWFSTFLITRPFEQTERAFLAQLDFLAALGAKIIGVSEQSYSTQGKQVPIFEERHEMDDTEWTKLCEGLNKLGEIAANKGIRLTYHHHMGTVVQTAAETDHLMAHTDPALVHLLFDSGHLAYCDEDPLAVLQAHLSRVAHVHLKDIRPAVVQRVRQEHLSFLDGVRAGSFTVPGDGAIDFDPLFEQLAGNGYDGWLLVEAEQDPAVADPLEYALKARSYIREHAGV